jgi:hypothetical protein
MTVRTMKTKRDDDVTSWMTDSDLGVEPDLGKDDVAEATSLV